MHMLTRKLTTHTRGVLLIACMSVLDRPSYNARQQLDRVVEFLSSTHMLRHLQPTILRALGQVGPTADCSSSTRSQKASPAALAGASRNFKRLLGGQARVCIPNRRQLRGRPLRFGRRTSCGSRTSSAMRDHQPPVPPASAGDGGPCL
jgi:hypothetical protein